MPHIALVEKPFAKTNEGFDRAGFLGAGWGDQGGDVAWPGDSFYSLGVEKFSMVVVCLVHIAELVDYEAISCTNELLDDFLDDVSTDVFSVITSLPRRSPVFSFKNLLLILLNSLFVIDLFLLGQRDGLDCRS